jgi:hypothetical protein
MLRFYIILYSAIVLLSSCFRIYAALFLRLDFSSGRVDQIRTKTDLKSHFAQYLEASKNVSSLQLFATSFSDDSAPMKDNIANVTWPLTDPFQTYSDVKSPFDCFMQPSLRGAQHPANVVSNLRHASPLPTPPRDNLDPLEAFTFLSPSTAFPLDNRAHGSISEALFVNEWDQRGNTHPVPQSAWNELAPYQWISNAFGNEKTTEPPSHDASVVAALASRLSSVEG